MSVLPVADIMVGDVRARLAELPAAHFHSAVTSPPYWGLRDYGVADQIGLEESPQAFVDKMVAVFRDVRRVLRDDGTLWLNLGDSYCSSDKWGGSSGGKNYTSALGGFPRERAARQPSPGLKSKDLCGVPWSVALALQADGWYLRQDVIWHKPSPRTRCCRCALGAGKRWDLSTGV